MTILQASYRSVAGSVLVCPTSFWMPCCWTLRSPMRRSWRCGSSVTFLTFSNMLVVPQNSFVSFDGKPFQVHPSSSVVFLLKLQNEEAGTEAAFLALPYLVLVVVFLLQLLCRKTSRKRPRPTEVLYVSRQMQFLCVLRRRFKNRWLKPTLSTSTSLNSNREIVIQQWIKGVGIFPECVARVPVSLWGSGG